MIFAAVFYLLLMLFFGRVIYRAIRESRIDSYYGADFSVSKEDEPKGYYGYLIALIITWLFFLHGFVGALYNFMSVE